MKGEILSIETTKKIAELENINDKLSNALNSAEDRIDKAIDFIEESYDVKVKGIEGISRFFSDRNKILLEILKGEDNE